MTHAVTTTELFLVAMVVIFAVPYLVWRVFRTDYWAPLVVVQIIAGILLGPGVLGKALPELHATVFNPRRDPRAQWRRLVGGDAVRDDRRHRTRRAQGLGQAPRYRHHRRAGAGRAAAAGGAVAVVMLGFPGWIGDQGQPWQFVAGIGMACAVTALPILILLMEKLDILRQHAGPAHPALRQPRRHRDLGRAGADPDGLATDRTASRLLGPVRARLRRLPRVDAPHPGTRPLVRDAGLAGDLRIRCRLVRPALHGRRLPGRRGDGMPNGSTRPTWTAYATTCCW